MVKLIVEKLPNFPANAELKYATDGACAFDLVAAIDEPITLSANMADNHALIPTGIKVIVPDGYAFLIMPRSSSNKTGLMIPNSPGLADTDYRGQIFVGLVKLFGKAVTINPGDRIAQAMLARIGIAYFDYQEVQNDTARGEGGFGSTGK